MQKRSGNVTGMGIRYPGQGLTGTRLFDFEVNTAGGRTRLYSLLNYSKSTLLVFGDTPSDQVPSEHLQVIQLQTENPHYAGQMVLVRPDSYIDWAMPIVSQQSPASL